MTTTALASLRLERKIAATPEEIYAAWTQADLLTQWFAPSSMHAEVLELDVKVGGRFRIAMHENDSDKTHTGYGEFVELVPGKRVVMTWGWENDMGVHDTLLTANFHAADGGTLIELLHEKLPSQESAANHTKGWTSCLENLAAHIGDFQ